MRARGFSLVEFMIAMTIGLMLIAGLVYLIAETSRSRAEMERSSRQIENGRYALDRLAEDLRHAGFFSDYFSTPGPGEAGFPADLAAAAPCAVTIATLPAGMPLALQAYDGGATLPADLTGAGCSAAGLVAANYQLGTDILVVRRASTSGFCPTGAPTPCATGVPSAAMVANQPYIQTTPAAYKVGDTLATFQAPPVLEHPAVNNTETRFAPLRRYVVRIYFVAKCNVPASGTTCNGTTDDGGTSIPTLKMLELSPGPEFRILAVAEGIEQLQYDFGIDTTGDGVADTVSMCNATTPCTAIDFSNVVSVQVSLVARNTERSPSYYDDKTYSLGLWDGIAGRYTPATAVAGYRRHAYSAQVRLNNVAMRRE